MSFIYSRTDEDRTIYCFWEMVSNMFYDMLEFIDNCGYIRNDGEKMVDLAIDRFLERRYFEDGHGGLFPLKHPRTDQRNVEIWYQMNQYLNERMTEEGRL